MNQLTQIGNKIYDYLYELWYGYRRAKAKDPIFPLSIKSEVVPTNIPPYLKPDPLKANSRVSTGTKFCKKMQDGLSVGTNQRIALDFGTVNVEQPITSKVWVYNASKLTHEVDHPTLGRVKIPGNTSRKRYAMWTSFPNLVRMPSQVFGDNGEILVSTRVMCGKRFAMDLINPDNLGLDQSFTKSFTSIGRNLGVRGVFWSEHNPPKKAEVDAAIIRLETFYRDLLERAAIAYEATQFSAKRVEELMKKEKISLAEGFRKLKVEAMQLSPEHHAAAEWFKVTTPWHPVLGVK